VHVLELFSLRADGHVSECRASGGREKGVHMAAKGNGVERCLLSVVVQGARVDEPAAVT
jgi:hypothetical protein